MLRATDVVRREAVQAEAVAESLTLDHSARHRRRLVLTCDGGLAVLLDLERATVLDDGDALRLEDGRLIVVRAAPERLAEIRTGDPLSLMVVAWHLGNRHVPAEITRDAIYIAEDHVLVEMVRGLGASALIVERPFRPERGAYDHEGGHGPSEHGHAHNDHGHAHGRSHAGHV